MNHPTLHSLITAGNLGPIQAFLATHPADCVNAYDRAGYTPLMRAVMNPVVGVEIVRVLLAHGAGVQQTRRSDLGDQRNVLSLALGAGDPAKVQLLLQHGADIHYVREQGYAAVVDAVHGRDVFKDSRLLDLLGLLIANAVDLDQTTSYGESGCRVLSRLGRFDAVQLLLDAGADAEPLGWTALLSAVALGTVAEVERLLDQGASLEERDGWERTPWLLAVQSGDIDKASVLRARGADVTVSGRCAKPTLFYAIESWHTPMLRWLLENGFSLEATNEFGETPLMTAVESGNAEAVHILLEAGALVEARYNDQTALSFATSREIVLRLLDSGANPRHLSTQGRRALLGLPAEPDEELLVVSTEEFLSGRTPRAGNSNPEKVVVPFWEQMIRAGVTGYQATQRLGKGLELPRGPVWCAQRFGQSLTLMPDGRIVQVAGEHEDHYDPDFCIYNDVFVHHPDGSIDIYAYPEAAFPPTDFHTATLVGESIYLIGSLGYAGSRQYGHTPVHRLDARSFRMETINTIGTVPGWIYDHAAMVLSPDGIQVSGGKIVTWNGSEEQHNENLGTFILHLRQGLWTKVQAATW